MIRPLQSTPETATPMTAHSPIGQRLAGVLASRLRRRKGRLAGLELVLVHTVAAGTGWTTDWRVRAVVEDPGRSATIAPAASTPGLRTIDRGELPAGRALDQLWRWVLDTSLLHRLPAPALAERIVFRDAAPDATVEVIRHRVLRAAAVLDRLPHSLQVRLGKRREAAADEAAPAAGPDPGSGPGTAAAPGRISIVRLVARFPAREGAAGETRVVVWESERHPALVALLRGCARRFDPGSTGQASPFSALPESADP